MTVIYVGDQNPNDPAPGSQGAVNGAGSLIGNVLGSYLGNLYQTHERTKALQAVQGMDPVAATSYLDAQLGTTEGGQMAADLISARLNAQKITQGQLLTIDQGYQNTIDKAKASTASQSAQYALQAQAAGIAAENARAVASYASANSDAASAQESLAAANRYNMESQIAQQTFNANASIVKGILAFGVAGGDTSQATQHLSNDPHFAGGYNGSPAPQVPGAPPQPTDPADTVNKAAILTGIALGTISPSQLAVAFPPDSVQGNLSPIDKLAGAGAAMKGDYSAVDTIMNQATKPKSVKLTQRAPGVYQSLATFTDGTTGWVGRPQLKLSATPIAIDQTANALSSWKGTIDGLAKLDASGDMNNRAARTASALLTRAGLDSPLANASAVQHFLQARNHAILLAGAIMRGFGGARAQKLQEQVQDLLPDVNDGPAVKNSKLDAANALLDQQVKGVVTNLVTNGQVVPPELQSYYNDRGLDKKTFQQLSGEYSNLLPAGDRDDAGGETDAGNGSVNSSPSGADSGNGTTGPDNGDASSEAPNPSISSPSPSQTLQYDAQGNLVN